MYFTPIKISNLEEIQKEVITVIQEDALNLSLIKSGFYAGKTALLKAMCPNLNKFLQDIGLRTRWVGTGISILNKENLATIHTDSADPSRIFALNIPILNCQNSYTVWYDVEHGYIPKKESYNSFGNDIVSFNYDNNKVTEVVRLESNNPAFVNIKIPHTGITNHSETRILISLRFQADLTENEIIELCKENL